MDAEQNPKVPEHAPKITIPPAPEGYLNRPDTLTKLKNALVIGVSKRTLNTLLSNGTIESGKRGQFVYVLESSVDAYIKERLTLRPRQPKKESAPINREALRGED